MKYILTFIAFFTFSQTPSSGAEVRRILETVPTSFSQRSDEGGGAVVVKFSIRLKNISKNTAQSVTVKLTDLQIGYSAKLAGCEPWRIKCPGSGDCKLNTGAPPTFACYKMDLCHETKKDYGDPGNDDPLACKENCDEVARTTPSKNCRISNSANSRIRLETKKEVGGKHGKTERYKVDETAEKFVQTAAPASSTFSFSEDKTEFTKLWVRYSERANMKANFNLFDGTTRITKVLVSEKPIPAGGIIVVSKYLHCTTTQTEFKCQFTDTYVNPYSGNRLQECDPEESSTVFGPCISAASFTISNAYKVEVHNDSGAILGNTVIDLDLNADEPVPVQSMPLNGGRPF